MNTYIKPKGLKLATLKKSTKKPAQRRLKLGALRALIHARHDGVPLNARPASAWASRAAWSLEQPPLSNTGVTVSRTDMEAPPLWAGVHWFAGTVRAMKAEEVVAVVGEFLHAAPEPRKNGGYGYAHSAGILKASVYWSPGRGDVFVVLPGEACEQLALPGLVALATTLDMVPTSRLDVAWDGCPFEPRTVSRAFEAGDVVTRIQRKPKEDERQDRCRGVEYRSNAEGDTVYLGSRQSERYVRVYDRRGSTRLELELKAKRAIHLWKAICASAEENAGVLSLGVLRDFLDFKDQTTAENPRDRQMLPWWAEFTAGAAKLVCIIPRQPVTLQKIKTWIKKQVAGAFALAFDADVWGGGFVRDILATGRKMYSKRPERLVMLQNARAQHYRAA